MEISYLDYALDKLTSCGDRDEIRKMLEGLVCINVAKALYEERNKFLVTLDEQVDARRQAIFDEFTKEVADAAAQFGRRT